VQLIGARISDGQTLTDSKVGLGDKILAATTSTAAAAGSAAGLILAAPVAVVDADTRDNYAGQVSGLTGPVGRQPKASECTAAGRSKETCRQ
jgi:hypothetical protein